MGKRRGFFEYVRRLFSFSSSSSSSPDPKPKTKPKQQDKEKKRRWHFGKLRSSPALLPPSSAVKARTLEEAEEQQSKHALAVAVATAAAAEAAVAAAQAAAEVVRLTGLPSSGFQNNHESAAVRIQTAFRGYLARRALRALKGLVKLQALVRGRAVRRQTNIALKNLQSLIKIQTEARVTRMKMLHESLSLQDKDRLHQRRAKDVAEVGNKFEQNKEKRWDCSPLSKEKANAMFVYRQEAALKRERALEYASSRRQGRRSASRRHSLPLEREPEEAEELNRRWSWLEQWVGNQPWDTTNNLRDIRPVPSPEDNPQDLQERVLKTVPDTDPHPQKRNSNTKEEQEFRPPLAMRRSFNRSRRGYIRDDESFTSSPAFPSYMHFTESAKARSRSISTPKQRFGATPDGIFPDNHTLLQGSSRHLSPFTSVCSDASVAKLAGRASNNRYQKSPRLKGPPPVAAAAPLVPHRSSKDFSRKEP